MGVWRHGTDVVLDWSTEENQILVQDGNKRTLMVSVPELHRGSSSWLLQGTWLLFSVCEQACQSL